MTYQEFKDYLVSYLWKTGDQQLINNLDTLIRAANAELNRTLKVEARYTSITFPAISNNITLPSDYHSIRSLVDALGYYGEFRYVTQPHLRAINHNTSFWPQVYSLQNNVLLLAGPPELAQCGYSRPFCT